MKKIRHLLSLYLIFTLLAASGCGASGSQVESATDSGDTWTVLFYMCGTDLESESSTEPGGTYNLEEITKTTPSENVHFVVETGGCKEWHAADLGLDISTDKLQRYAYTENGFELVDEQPGASMGDPGPLSDFISWGKKTYPADKYMLIMWDHGSGAHGLLSDELFPNQSGNPSMLTLNEWEQALKDGGVNFELILTDCCLMANLETAQMLAPYAKYLVASEEVFPGKGSASDMWLQYLCSSPGSDGLRVGRMICDMTQQKYKDLRDDFTSETLTLSVIDLSKIDAVAAAFDNMFTEIGGMLTDLTTFHEVAYYTSLADTFSYGDMTTGMVDLVDFATKAYQGALSEKAMLDITNAVADCVVYQVKGTEHSYAGGLSFYKYTDVCGINRLERYGNTCKSAPYLAYIDAIADNWEAPEWVYEKTEPVTISEDFKIPTATAGQREDGSFYADFENEECLI
ncbi:MAG: clostripain-related cysteine peptidase, partial [Lachnospiraceae bacterium]|nr:clostripain-related cysteine peptidase [Lachnospiraceae bacterium]